MLDRSKSTFNGIGGFDVFAVFNWKVLEGQQRVTIFDQAFGGLFIFDAIFDREPVHCPFNIRSGLGQPDFLEILASLGLGGFGHLVEDIGGLVDPTAELVLFLETTGRPS